MHKFHASSFDPDQQNITKTIEKMNAEKSEKKNRLLLAYEIQNREQEIVFLTSKISMMQKQIHQIYSAITLLDSKMSASKSELSSVLKDRNRNFSGFSDLNQLETELHNRLSELPELKRAMLETRKGIDALNQELQPLEEEWVQISEKRSELDESANIIDVELSGLEQELSIMRETKGLLYGILPQGYNLDLIDDLSVNFEQCIQNYYDEIESQIVGVTEQIMEIEHLIAKEEDYQKLILPERNSLERESRRVIANALLHESTLFSELEELRSKHQEIKQKNIDLTEMISMVSIEIKDLDGSILTQQELLAEIDDRYQRLLALKLKIDKIDKIEEELKKINTMIRQTKAENSINKSMFETVSTIKSDLYSTNDRLKSIYKDFNSQIEKFDKSFNSLFLEP
ncbi:MAG: hypothetical protein HQK65_03960 [Desulfamplus sp.]|nr:hypothetical protein [Desulfamplus sp.]